MAEQTVLRYYKNLIGRCQRCDQEKYISSTFTDWEENYDETCLLCDRYYRQKKLFLNNVG